MNLREYKQLAKEKQFDEHPYVIFAGQTELRHFLQYEELDLEVKQYLAKVILCRNFSPAGGYEVMSDHTWFIRKFLEEYNDDPLRPEMSNSIREGILMVLEKDPYIKPPIGCSFLFGVVEYWTKYLLGWRPSLSNLHEKEYHKPYRELSLPQAINRVKKTHSSLANVLNEIDTQSIGRVKETGIEKKRGVIPKMADRLFEARNPMLHGERYWYYHMGTYLTMIYVLFYLHHSE